ncbi:MAG: 4Fe-4S binding protein [Candidatus Bathyarchaeota archaeon]|nr:4Fe-4S binding protein [Candidatus Bathyarchaeota archaeon]
MAMEIVGDVLRGIIISGLLLAGILVILIWVKDKTARISTLRLFVQIAFVPLLFLGLLIGPFGMPQSPQVGNAPREVLLGADILGHTFPDGISLPVLACWYPSGRTVTCPVWQMQAYIFPFWNAGPGFGWGTFYSSSGIERLAILMGIFIVMALVLGRFFCGWICPFGLYQDLMIRVRKLFKKAHLNFSDRTSAALRQSRYIIIAIFLILSVILGSQAIFGAQLVPDTQPGEYFYSYFTAPFCQVCPMRSLCVLLETGLGFMDANFVFSNTHGAFYEVGYYVTSLNLIVLGVVTVVSLAYRRAWCRICPLGGLTALFSTFAPFKRVALMRLHKDEEKCTKCGICKRVCPTQVTEVYEEKGGDVTASGCMLCFRCVEMCPYEDTLKVKMAGKTVLKSRNWLEPSESE